MRSLRRAARCTLLLMIGSAIAGRALAAESERGSSGRAIYRCTIAGVTTFADRPCAPAAAPYRPDASRVSTYSPPPVTRVPAASARPAKAAKRAVPAATDQVRHAADCERIRAALDQLASRMRSGYRAREGEQLRERKARLEQQRRMRRCR